MITLRRSLILLLLIGGLLSPLLGATSVAAASGVHASSHAQVARAASCNTTATGSWSNNCTIYEGNISNFVYAIQETILESNAPCNPGNADGDFGPQTLAAVKCFQKWSGFPLNQQDGIVGPQTWGALQHTLTNVGSYMGWTYWVTQFNGQIFRESDADREWQVFVYGPPVNPKNVWCTINFNHC